MIRPASDPSSVYLVLFGMDSNRSIGKMYSEDAVRIDVVNSILIEKTAAMPNQIRTGKGMTGEQGEKDEKAKEMAGHTYLASTPALPTPHAL